MGEQSDPQRPVLSYASPSLASPRDHTRWGDICLGGAAVLLTVSVLSGLERANSILMVTLPGTAALALAAGVARILTPRSRGRLRPKSLGYPLWVCVLLVAASVGALLLVASQPRVRVPALRVRCASNLRQLGQACLLYNRDFGGVYPDSLERLLITQDIAPDAFCCPHSTDSPAVGPTTQAMIADFRNPGRCSYIYVGAGMKEPIDPEVIIAYEPLANHSASGMNVLFGEGHVEFISAKEAQYILSELAAGHNPPRKRGADGTPIDRPASAPAH